MIEATTQVRVRYAETDMMGVVYNANYAIYFEVARTEMFRKIGMPYAEMERNGVRLPVVDLHCRYYKSAYYDDLLTLTARVKEMPKVKIVFEYEIRNEAGDLLADGYTTLAFMDIAKQRPIKMPEYVERVISKYFD